MPVGVLNACTVDLGDLIGSTPVRAKNYIPVTVRVILFISPWFNITVQGSPQPFSHLKLFLQLQIAPRVQSSKVFQYALNT